MGCTISITRRGKEKRLPGLEELQKNEGFVIQRKVSQDLEPKGTIQSQRADGSEYTLSFNTANTSNTADQTKDEEAAAARAETELDLTTAITSLANSISSFHHHITHVRNLTLEDVDELLENIVLAQTPNTFLPIQNAAVRFNELRANVEGASREAEVRVSKDLTSPSTNMAQRWTIFGFMTDEQKRDSARREKGDVTSMFRYLTKMRTGCENLLVSSGAVEKVVNERFEDILEAIKLVDDRVGGVNMGGGNVVKWRVFQMVVQKRCQDIRARVEGLLEKRMEVSSALLSYVEELGELESAES